MTDEAKKEDRTPWWSYTFAVAVVLVIALVVASPKLYPHYYGATAEDVATVALNQTTKGVAKALPCTAIRGTEVETTFRHTVVGFDSASFSWNGSADQVSGIGLHAEREHEEPTKKKEANHEPRALEDRLDDYLPGVTSNGKREWGSVRFDASSKGDLSFGVTASSGDHGINSLFARQVEAARQILVAVAFDIPPTLSKGELADMLGTGYPLADVAQLDPQAPQTATVSVLTARFPAAFVPGDHNGDRIRVPIDHPLVSDITLRWSPFRRKHTFDASLHTRRSFPNRRAAFVECLGTKTSPAAIHSDTTTFHFGAPDERGIALEVKSDSLETTSYAPDATAFSAVIRAIDACR